MDIVKLKINTQAILDKQYDNSTLGYLENLTKYNKEDDTFGMSRLILAVKEQSNGVENDELIETLTSFCDVVRSSIKEEYSNVNRVHKIKTIKHLMDDYKLNGSKGVKVTNLFIKDSGNKIIDNNECVTVLEKSTPSTISGGFYALLEDGNIVMR